MKNIVFCADGTWNGSSRDEDGDGVPDVTNVARLYGLLDGTPTAETVALKDEQEKELPAGPGAIGQVAKYLHGVGDSGNAIGRVVGGVFGAGLVGRIVRGYTYISRHYEAGDRIVISGFSRGAYTARALAGLIASMGLLKPPAPGEDRELAYRKGVSAWAGYRRKSGLSGSLLDVFGEMRKEPVTDADFVRPVAIGAVAVWDTVGSYGIPLYNLASLGRLDLFQFADTALSPQVEHGFHAIAIDERRLDFVPTLWDERAGVEQVWFAGAHADVGGGYPQPVLALYSLRWMVERLRSIGIVFGSEMPAWPTAFEPIHLPWTQRPFKGLPNGPRKHPQAARFHRSVQSMLSGVADYQPESLQPFMNGRELEAARLVG